MLTPFADEIWIADGDTVSTAGFHYPTRMIVIRLDCGGLFVWSPVTLTSELKESVDALGPVTDIVGPNALHHLFIGEWGTAYPSAILHAAPGLRKKRADLSFHTDLTDAPHPNWAGELDQVVLRGNVLAEDVVFYHRKSRTVIFTDVLQQFPKGWFVGWRAIIARLDLMEGPVPSVPRKFRLAFTQRRQARAAVRVILGWPVDNILMAHGAPVRSNAADTLRIAFRWLRP